MGTEVIPMLEWATAGVTLPGQEESGDLHVVKQIQGGVLAGVVDGLGHGSEAAAAARTAVETLERHAEDPLILLVERCHERLKRSRGAVMSLATVNAEDGTMTWLGVGNVDAILVRKSFNSGAPIRRLISRGGVVGYQLPDVRTSTIQLGEGDLLIFATDGIRRGFVEGSNFRDPPQKLADRICSQFSTGTDDALVLVVRYGGSKP